MSLSQSTLQKINGFVSALQSVFEQKSNKVTSISSNSTDTQYPSAKVVYDQLDGKVSINQGASNNGKFLKVSNGNVVCETVSLSGSGMTIDRIYRSNNLNDYISLGFYYIDSSDLDYVTNVPSVASGDTNAILFVEAVADEYIKQTISFDEDIYVRFYNDYEVSWSNWIDIRNPKSHTGLGYGGGTSSAYGHVKLSDSYTSSDGAASASVGASSKAVSDSYGTLSTIKENKYGFWYGNSNSNTPTWGLHVREDPLQVKQNTPIKIFVYTKTSNGHDNVCNLGESVQYLFAKIVINDVIYTQYMDTTTKTINMPIAWSSGNSGNMTIHVFWGEWHIGSDVMRFTVVDNYS